MNFQQQKIKTDSVLFQNTKVAQEQRSTKLHQATTTPPKE
jgi:hypothetical protein